MGRFYSTLAAIVLILISNNCGPQYTGKSFSFSDIQIDKTPTKNTFPNNNAVYLLREAKFEIQAISTFSEHIVVKVLKEGGKKYANVRIPLWQDWKVLDIKARTIKPNGEIVNINQKDIFEITDFPEYIMYADRKAKVFTLPAVDTGCILEYTYAFAYKSPYVPVWYFQGPEPTVIARFTYDVPFFLGFDHLVTSVPGCDVRKEVIKKDARHRATFVAENLPAVTNEPLAPSINDISSWIMMVWASFRMFFLPEVRSGQETWYEIGKNYSLITDTLLEPTSEIKAKVAELITDCAGDQEKIEKVYEFVRDNFRYVAVEMEGHQIIPNSPQEVLKNQYGDCKDLSGFLVSMLRAAGIDAYLVLTKTKEAGNLIERFPALGQINHVIVAIAIKHFVDTTRVSKAISYGDIYFANNDDFLITDPTAPTYPLGQIHSQIQGRNAVLCAGIKSKLIKLPKTSFKDNVCATEIVFNLDDTDYYGMIKIKATGDDAAFLRYIFIHASATETKNFIQTYLSEFPLKMSVDTFEILNIRDFDSVLEVNIKFKRFSPLQTAKGQVFIPVMFKTLQQFTDIYSCPDRMHNVELPYPDMRKDVFKLVVPTGYKLHSLPERDICQNQWCEYTCSAYLHSDTVIVNRNIAIKDCTVPQNNFPELRTFATKVLDSSNKIIVLSSK